MIALPRSGTCGNGMFVGGIKKAGSCWALKVVPAVPVSRGINGLGYPQRYLLYQYVGA